MIIIVFAVLALVGLGILAWAVGLFNSLVAVRNQVDLAWANIDVVLKERHDMLTKLIEVVKGAKDFEQSTLEKVVAARNRYSEASGPNQTVAASNGESSALRQIFALAESYPDLKATANFAKLQDSVEKLEEIIADRRELYNAAVNINNNRIAQFPDMIVAPMAGLSHRDLFKVDEADRADVVIKF